MTHTTEQLEKMLSGATPGPWLVAFRENGTAYCSFGNPSYGPHLQFDIGLDSGGMRDPANAALIAAAPTITSELIAAHKRIAELEALRKPAIYSAAVIGSFYEWVERVEKAGGPTCISGIAECNAMIKSLRKNAKRADELVMKPIREAIAALEAKP